MPVGYTAVGAPTYTVSGNKINFTGVGGLGGIGKYIRSDLGVLEECNTVNATITLNQAPNTASYGIGVGLQSYNPYCATQTVVGGIVLADGNVNYGCLLYTSDAADDTR